MDCLKSLMACLAILLLVTMISFSEAKELVVGGKKSRWEVPSSPDTYNQWAQSKRFQIGDAIVLKYDGKSDSVLQVSEESFKSCTKSNPIQSYNDGNTKITFDKSGPFYFISGADGHCEKGQKLEITVMSEKHHHHPEAPGPSPAGDHHAPAPAPKKSGCGNGMEAGFMGGLAALVIGFMAFV